MTRDGGQGTGRPYCGAQMWGGQSSDRRTAADDKNKQMGQTMPDNKHNYEYNYDLGDVIDNAVEMGSRIGSSVLGLSLIHI